MGNHPPPLALSGEMWALKAGQTVKGRTMPAFSPRLLDTEVEFVRWIRSA